MHREENFASVADALARQSRFGTPPLPPLLAPIRSPSEKQSCRFWLQGNRSKDGRVPHLARLPQVTGFCAATTKPAFYLDNFSLIVTQP